MQKSGLKLIDICGIGHAALLALVAGMFPVAAQSAPAARVDFTLGDMAAVNKAGLSRPLAKGAQVEQGETINTNNGRAQLRFTDGAYVSLQPQSEFRIDQYADMLPSSRALLESIVSTPREMGGLGLDFQDYLESSRRAAPIGRRFGPSAYGT